MTLSSDRTSPPDPEASSSAVDAAASRDVGATYLRTTLLSRIAHDIRGPAGVTVGAVDELEGSLGPAAEQHRAWFNMIRRGLRRLTRVADRLSMVAELEGGTLELNPVRTDAVALVRKGLDLATLLQGRSAVKIATDLPEQPVEISADAHWLEPTFMEIVGNAIRFAYRNVRIHGEVKDGGFELSVEDDGAGFSAQAKELMFARLVPRESSGGMGLSLSIARDVVVAHGGTMTLHDSTLPMGRAGTTGAKLVVRLKA